MAKRWPSFRKHLAAARPLLTDFVAKVFLGWRTKNLRAADAPNARRCEGPFGLIQKRSRTFAVPLKDDAAEEMFKNRLWREF